MAISDRLPSHLVILLLHLLCIIKCVICFSAIAFTSLSSVGLVKEHHFTLIHVHGWTEESEPQPKPHAVWNAIQEYEKAQKGITAPTVVMCK